MKEIETLGLIVLTYDYKPSPNSNILLRFNDLRENQIDYKDVATWRLVTPVNDYLKRKGYFDKYEGRPTLKLYKLLSKHGVKIPKLKQYQDEYEKTGHVTQYDKLGNKRVL